MFRPRPINRKIPTVPRTRLTTVPDRIGSTMRTPRRIRRVPPVRNRRLSPARVSTYWRNVRPRRYQAQDPTRETTKTTTAPSGVRPPYVVLYSQQLHDCGDPLPTLV